MRRVTGQVRAASIWKSVQSSLILSWAILAAVSIVAYSGILLVLKGRQLRTSLAIASETVNESLQAGDWPLALGHLKSLEKAEHVFDISLKGQSSSLSGPFGAPPFGVGRLCAEHRVNSQYTLSACVRVLAGTEVYTLLFFVLFSGAVFYVALVFFERKLLDFVEQVAHDIRSPLAALEAVLGDLAQIPEDRRLLIRSAAGRIRDIANDLLQRHRPISDGQDSGAALLLSSLVEPVVTEKRLQFRSRHEIEIEAKLESSYGAFVSVPPAEFKRVLSNLVNNAVEAIEAKSGKVEVGVTASSGMSVVTIRDDGKGIEPKTLAKLGARGESHGKAGGMGLGLHHARSCSEAWGGRLEIASEPGRGTTVSICLPQAEAPDWFISELILPKATAVVVLDDDPSIHKVWEKRLDMLGAKGLGIATHAFSTAAQLRAWVKDDPQSAGRAIFLLDYELAGERDTGLSVAQDLKLGDRAVLVTSRSEEPGLIASCREIGVRMIPKGAARLLPLRIGDPAGCDVVLIDDDPLVRNTWELKARQCGRRIRTFSSALDFLRVAAEFERSTPIYVDAWLENDDSGAARARTFHELGFKEIYLETGDQPEKFEGLSYLRGVIGKSPPWEEGV